MKTVSKYWNMACMAMLIGVATGCTSDEILNNDDQTGAGEVKMDTIRVTMGTADTRIAYDDTQLKLAWETGDQIRIIAERDLYTSEIYTLVGEGGSSTGTFAGKALTGSRYIINYPKDYYFTTESGMLDLKLDYSTQTQNGDNSAGHLKNHIVAIALSTNLASSATLGHGSAILKFHFTNLPTDLGTLKSITWKSSIQRAFETKLENSIPTYSPSQTLGLDGITITDSDQEVTAYMAVNANSTPPTLTAGSTIRAIVTGTNGKSYYAEATINGEIKYEGGKRYTAEMDGTTPMAWTEVVN